METINETRIIKHKLFSICNGCDYSNHPITTKKCPRKIETTYVDDSGYEIKQIDICGLSLCDGCYACHKCSKAFECKGERWINSGFGGHIEKCHTLCINLECLDKCQCGDMIECGYQKRIWKTINGKQVMSKEKCTNAVCGICTCCINCKTEKKKISAWITNKKQEEERKFREDAEDSDYESENNSIVYDKKTKTCIVTDMFGHRWSLEQALKMGLIKKNAL